MAVEDGRGTLGGIQFSRNSSGAFCSLRTIPSFPNTVSQQEYERNFRDVLGAWSRISQSQRDGWEAEAATGDWDRLNSVGDSYQPTGQSLFIELNLSVYAESFLIADAPTWRTITNVTLSSADTTAPGTVTLNFSAGSINPNHGMAVYGTKGRLNGSYSLKRPDYRFLGLIDEAGFSSAVSFGTEYVARFGNMVAGQIVFFKTQLLYIPTGQRVASTAVRTLVS